MKPKTSRITLVISFLLLSLTGVACASSLVSESPVVTVVPSVPLVTEAVVTPSEAAPESEPSPDDGATIAYIGMDGNLWVIEPGGEGPRQLTQDGTSLDSYPDQPSPTVNYYFPAISSDGRFLAVRRDEGTPIESGMEYEFGLWVYDLASGEASLIYDKTPAGFAWKPGTHILAYGLGVETEYFIHRGQPDASLARGIWAADLDTGATSELVAPERGYALYSPTWSPDGRYLGFDELLYMEGRGPFAYYDFESRQYIPWNDPIGNYEWSADSSRITYDYLTYSPIGTERILLKEFPAGTETQFSPEIEGGYMFHPVFSPQSDRIAYLVALGGPDSFTYNLYIQDLAGGESRDLGFFESVWDLVWMPDGGSLLFSAGPYEARQVLQISVFDGSVIVLGSGNSPAVSGR